MNKMILGAAGLLLSTSALAGVSMTKADDAKWMPAAQAASSFAPKPASGLDDAMIGNAMLIDWNAKNAVSAETASLDVKAMDEPKLLQAAPVKPVENMAPLTEAELAAKPQAMPAETDETMAAKPAAAPNEGMGGPLETAEATTLDLSPRPATQNYPACSPGPGDDSCIQLYEPGVQTALASWSGQTGGFDNGQVGMGGPEEPMHETSAVKASHEEAAYEPLPEDSVMPAEEEVAYSDTSKGEDTLAI